jgi:hypothetical protein
MAKPKARITESLKQTVIDNPAIDKVHFNANGGHMFNVHKHGNELYGRVIVDKVYDAKRKGAVETRTPVQSTKVVETVGREDIIAAEAVPDPKSGLISLDGKK